MVALFLMSKLTLNASCLWRKVKPFVNIIQWGWCITCEEKRWSTCLKSFFRFMFSSIWKGVSKPHLGDSRLFGFRYQGWALSISEKCEVLLKWDICLLHTLVWLKLFQLQLCIVRICTEKWSISYYPSPCVQYSTSHMRLQNASSFSKPANNWKIIFSILLVLLDLVFSSVISTFIKTLPHTSSSFLIQWLRPWH